MCGGTGLCCLRCLPLPAFSFTFNLWGQNMCTASVVSCRLPLQTLLFSKFRRFLLIWATTLDGREERTNDDGTNGGGGRRRNGRRSDGICNNHPKVFQSFIPSDPPTHHHHHHLPPTHTPTTQTRMNFIQRAKW